jgi:hypothetical protein
MEPKTQCTCAGVSSRTAKTQAGKPGSFNCKICRITLFRLWGPKSGDLAVESPVNKSTIPVIYECEWLSLRGEVDVISAGPFAHSQLKVLVPNIATRRFWIRRCRMTRVAHNNIPVRSLLTGIRHELDRKRRPFLIVVVYFRGNNKCCSNC